MHTLEQETIRAELERIVSIDELREIRRNVGQFHLLHFFGYKMRIERRRLRAADLRVGLGAFGMAALMSVAFALDRSLIYSFVDTAPIFSIVTAVGLAAAGYRRIRLSDWYMLFYIMSYITTAILLFPALMVDPSQINSFFAAGIVFSISLVIFLNISTCFYVVKANRWLPTLRPFHEIGA